MENKKIEVLIIDDNPDNILSLKAVIQTVLPKTNIITALNGVIGIKAAKKNDPDVILLDIIMPVMDGFDVCEIIKDDEVLSKIPVVFITAIDASNEIRLRAIEAGAEGFLSKPIDELALLTQIKSMAKIKKSNVSQEIRRNELEELVLSRTIKLDNELTQKLKAETELLSANKKLEESEKNFKLMFEDAPLAYQSLNEDGNFITVNNAWLELFGYKRKEVIGKWFGDFIDPKLKEHFLDNFPKFKNEGATCTVFNIPKKNGDMILINFDGRIGHNEDGSFRQTHCILRDITEQKKNEETLTHLSYHDQLTGLYNRRFFEEELNRMDTKRNLPISIIMGDINGLKLINDSFGHDVGDNYLKKTAEIIKKSCRADEIVARPGGDEFAIILPKADASEATIVTNRIKDMISDVKIGNIELSVSFGYATKESEKQPILDTVISAENHMYTHKIVERSSMRSKIVEIIMSALFEKSNRESQHSKRVSSICETIAIEMGLDKDDVNQIGIAGLVHDIGKIGIMERILNKVGSLDNDEWAEIKRHPEVGWRILSTTAEFSEVAEFVLHHHEHWDGSGYPNGLKGEEIPIEARIITVADTYDAMTSERSYRNPISKEEAKKEIQRCSGTQFDPKIADLFINDILLDKKLL